MADRTIKVGDTWPPLKGSARDANGLVNLSLATTLTVTLRGPTVIGRGAVVITGTPTIINPPETAEDGTLLNWRYTFQAGDTDVPGRYRVELTAVWAPGETETFPSSGAPVLQIER